VAAVQQRFEYRRMSNPETVLFTVNSNLVIYNVHRGWGTTGHRADGALTFYIHIYIFITFHGCIS
jgi:hypothetical protein